MTGAQVYKASSDSSITPTSTTLWNSRGRTVANVAIPKTSKTGWITVEFPSAVTLVAGKTYTVSVQLRAVATPPQSAGSPEHQAKRPDRSSVQQRRLPVRALVRLPDEYLARIELLG